MRRSKRSRQCPRCSSRDALFQDSFEDGIEVYVCADCDYEFEVGRSHPRHRSGEDEFDDDPDAVTADEAWEN